MKDLGPVTKLTVAEGYDGIRLVRRTHTNGESHTKLRKSGDRWETVSHVEVRHRRPGDKWLP